MSLFSPRKLRHCARPFDRPRTRSNPLTNIRTWPVSTLSLSPVPWPRKLKYAGKCGGQVSGGGPFSLDSSSRTRSQTTADCNCKNGCSSCTCGKQDAGVLVPLIGPRTLQLISGTGKSSCACGSNSCKCQGECSASPPFLYLVTAADHRTACAAVRRFLCSLPRTAR